MLEAHVERVEDALGVHMDKRVELYLWATYPDCKDAEIGCYNSAQHEINTSWAGVDHELVHAITADCDVEDKLHVEGLAEAFSNELRKFPAIVTMPSDNLGRKKGHFVDYATAGHFHRWLWETQGPGPTQRLLNGHSFHDSFGISLEEAEQQWLDEAAWVYPQHEPCPRGCAELPGDDDGWSATLELDCGRDDTTSGGYDGLRTCRSIDVTAAGIYGFESDGYTSFVRLTEDKVQEAESESWERYGIAAQHFGGSKLAFAPGEPSSAYFRQGRHMVCVESESQDTVTVGLEIWPTAESAVWP